MTLTQEEICSRFTSLPAASQAVLLATLSNGLTIAARSFYPDQAGADGDIRRLIGINEIQHNVSDHVGALLVRRTQRYPDDVLIAILFDKATIWQCQKELLWAFSQALERNVAA